MNGDAVHRDIPTGRIALLGLAWAGLVVVALLGVIGVLRLTDMPWTQGRPPAPRVDGPLQEAAPQPALDEYLAAKQAQLDGFGWVDRGSGVAHVPIDEAVKLLASGMPPLPVTGRVGAGRRIISARGPASMNLHSTLERVAAILAALLIAMALGSTAWAFSEAMPSSPAIPQGRIADRAAQVERLAPTQPLGRVLPLDTPLTDWQDKAVTLRDYFGQGPVVLVLGYYRCPNLCGTVMQGVLEALAATGLPTSSWRIVYVSVDPSEDPAIAADRRASWRAYFDEVAVQGTPDGRAQAMSSPSGAARIDTLLGSQVAVTAIAGAAGFAIEPDAHPDAAQDSPQALSRYAHPAEFMIATPDGRLSRFVFGVRFDARDLRLALVEASQERIGSLADRLVLLCSHYDPTTGRYDDAVMGLLRAIGLACVLGLALYAWRHRHASSTPGASA